MSVKKMVELYVKFECSEETWNMMYQMVCHGLISHDNWSKFFEKCKDWYAEFDGIHDCEKLLYKRDENGFIHIF